MNIVEYRDRPQLEKFLRLKTSWHLYALADLDEPFWDSTRWFVSIDGNKITGAVIIIQTMETPILYAICSPGDPITRSIVSAIDEYLPERFFAHVGFGVLDGLKRIKFHSEGEAIKMILTPGAVVASSASHQSEREDDFEALKEFYDQRAYGDDTESRFFEPSMLKMSPYRVIKEGGKIMSVAGVHVASLAYRVAALGNITTTPEVRGKGYASAAIAALVADLRPTFNDIGLNVLTNNAAAVHCYTKLGFIPCLKYEEGLVTRC